MRVTVFGGTGGTGGIGRHVVCGARLASPADDSGSVVS